jgi:NTE family protein
MSFSKQKLKIGLTLSGGGIRAAVFHLGVLRRLATENLLESITQISTVSGGSLVAAAIISRAAMRWPTSKEFLEQIYPSLHRLLTSTDLYSLKAIGWSGLFRFNFKLVYHRAAVLAQLLGDRWGLKGYLHELPEVPSLWINATCLETGKNWRFSKREMGDWRFGRHFRPPFLLAEAAAASAAVPYAIGALSLSLPTLGWYQTDPATRQPIRRREAPPSIVRLWDGGVYENLGLEFLYKPGVPLTGCDFLICSDASGPLTPTKQRIVRSLARGQLSSPRLFDISSDQIRSLRSRMLLRDIENRTIKGVLIRMGNSVRDIDIKSGRRQHESIYDQFQNDEEASLALLHPTDLKAVTETAFNNIARHGYEVTDATLATYAPSELPNTHVWSTTTS